MLGSIAGAQAVNSGPVRSLTDAIIVHTISGPLQNCPRGRLEFSGAPGDAKRWKAFFDRHPFLSIHYVIDRDGQVEISMPENRRANHALGASESSIGIELVHNGDGIEPFGTAQLSALITLLKDIRTRYGLPVDAVKGHADVDTRTFNCGGKTHKGRMDPGANFPWDTVRAALSGADVPGLVGVSKSLNVLTPKTNVAGTPSLAKIATAPVLLAAPRLVSRMDLGRQPPK